MKDVMKSISSEVMPDVVIWGIVALEIYFFHIQINWSWGVVIMITTLMFFYRHYGDMAKFFDKIFKINVVKSNEKFS